MKLEWLVGDKTSVGSPERAILGMILGFFVANSGHFSDLGATLCCRKPLLSPKNFPQGHLMKLDWLVADVPPVGYQSGPLTEQNVPFWGQFLAILWPI